MCPDTLVISCIPCNHTRVHDGIMNQFQIMIVSINCPVQRPGATLLPKPLYQRELSIPNSIRIVADLEGFLRLEAGILLMSQRLIICLESI